MKDSINIFIFRRDLRIEDNSALNLLYSEYPNTPILPIFIFNPIQIDKSNNPYHSQVAVNFMIESLNDLTADTKNSLLYFYGDDIDILTKILKATVSINTIAFNTDFTPYAEARDTKIIEWCKSKNINIITYNDYVLFDFKIKTESNTVYEVFTPFYKKCISNLGKYKDIIKPFPIFSGRFLPKSKSSKLFPFQLKSISKFIEDCAPQRTLSGGRQEGLNIMQKIKSKAFTKYDKERDYPSLDKTTKLSPYLKFGCLGIREVFMECIKAYGQDHSLVRELIWREFYACTTKNTPRVLVGQLDPTRQQNQTLKTKYNDMVWKKDHELFKKWCDGKTGFPFVDAAMICMKKTGYMHNRLRMIVAMFLTKDMFIDWREGEKYFAQHLVDYDPSSNNGGWQWAGSTGADSQPYFRIFNPWTQSKKFDKDAAFIKKWIPALATVPPAAIHEWYKECNNYNVGYPYPILEHSIESKKVKEYFSAIL